MTENTIIRQSENLLDMAGPMIEDMCQKIDRLYTDDQWRSFKKVILTGCGDSYIAGQAAYEAFQAFSGTSCDVMFTIDATYHLDPRRFNSSNYKTLAIGISISGTAAGTVKSMMACRDLGAETLAVTENVNSALAKKCHMILNHNSAENEVSPGTKTYFASVITLLMIAIKFGLVNGRLTKEQADKIKADIVNYANAFKDNVAAINAQTAESAKAFKDSTHFEFVGSGVDYSTAWFGRAKIYEAVGLVSTAENTEDWMHVNYYARKPKENVCIVIMSKGNTSNSRCMENIEAMAATGRPTMIITDTEDTLPEGMHVVRIPSAAKDYITPLLQFLPITLLCGHLAEEMNVPFFRGLAAPWGLNQGIRYVEGE